MRGGYMKKLITLIFLLIVLSSQIIPEISQIKTEIQTILTKQNESWNKGDIEGFMEYYWKSENFTFQSGNKRLSGWHSLLSRYKENYPPEKMGTLTFSDLDIRVLSKDIAYVLGRWKIIEKDSFKEGLFTILFQRMPDGWKIIHDHTS